MGNAKEQWRGDARGFELDRDAWQRARAEHEADHRTGFSRRRLAETAAKIPKAGFPRADM